MNEHDDLINGTNEVLDAEYLRITRIEPQLRRFARAMADLGAPVPRDWATEGDPEVVKFGSLSPKVFDRLLCLMEDLAANRPITVTVMRGGPTLFDPGAPAGPVAPSFVSSVHMVVPQ